MSNRRSYRLFVGVDVAATTFTVAWMSSAEAPSKPIRLAQTPEGYQHLQQQLADTGIPPADTLVVLEATSSYWVTLAVVLHQGGLRVSVVNPAHVAHYAKSLPRRSKSDALDAQLLAQFACERQPPLWTPPPQVYHELRQRLVARDALQDMRQHARNHRHALLQWPIQVTAVKEQLDAVIRDLDERIGALEREIAIVLHDGAWATSAALLQTIACVGPLTTAWLLVGTLNFQACPTPEAATAYVGLAPRLRESGSSVRGRAQIGHGGQKRVRTALYLVTFNAVRFNPVIRVFYERLRAAGKPPKVARCAAARKLLHIAWAVVTKAEAFDVAHGQKMVA
jgi:transposase